MPTKGPRHDGAGKLAERWSYGHFLGFSRVSNDYHVWTKDGAVKTRSTQRLTADRRWPAGELESVDQGAQSGYAARSPEFFEPGEDAQAPPVAPGRAAQSVQIRQADWIQHGSTPGCSKCIHAQTWGWGKMGGPHSEECLRRFEAFLMETEAGGARLRRAEIRQGVHPREHGG